ncbi:alpha-S1-casein-like [Dromiciops gliroides]|uniref:alpha-S1-casein-like n=1 Tax=Dromiciops gliroides TaxID=33562 RepID=UPI001CC4577C|nr:alpha-S1-casein-like [Dromiciops gliroides]XP_043825525.1 alpha-S1-casein-like [Dromiciops gliroides]
MKLLIFSCLVALALARPDVLNLSNNRHIKRRELENRLIEDVIPTSEVSSSEESLHQLNKVRQSLEKYEVNRLREDLKTSSSEESVAPTTEERVRRQVEYNFNEEDSSASRESKIEDVNEQYQHYLRRLQEERALNFRSLESLYYPTELRKPQEYREKLYMEQPEFYYPYVPIYVPRFMLYPVEASIYSTRNAPVSSINRATETVFTHSEEKKN